MSLSEHDFCLVASELMPLTLSPECATSNVDSQSESTSVDEEQTVNPMSTATTTMPAVTAHRHLEHPLQAALKRSADIVIAGGLLLVLWPVIAIACLLVKLTSKGEMIFKQVRVGRGKKPFIIYKIRSMTPKTRANDPKFAAHETHRITFIGHILRKLHIDELPQLWNVLRGDMSMIGPRPEMPEFVNKFEMIIPNYCDRLAVRPGLSGLAQVQLPPDTSLDDVKRKLILDRHYVREQSLLLDLKIVLNTVAYLAHIPFPLASRLLGTPGLAKLQHQDAE